MEMPDGQCHKAVMLQSGRFESCRGHHLSCGNALPRKMRATSWRGSSREGNTIMTAGGIPNIGPSPPP
jgi:hypothetical protein